MTACVNRSSSELRRRSSCRNGQPLETSFWLIASRRSSCSAGVDLEPAVISLSTRHDHALHAGNRLKRGPDRLGRTSCFQDDRTLTVQIGKLIVEGDAAAGNDDHPAADRLDLRENVGG